MQITLKGQTFDSPLTDTEATNRLSELIGDRKITSDFARSLERQYLKKRRLSSVQMNWVHKIVHDAEKPRATNDESVTGLESIQQHMYKCRTSREEGGKGLLYPKIALNVDGQPLVLKITGSQSKRPDHVSLSETGKFGEGTFYGYIAPDGTLVRYKGCTDAVVTILERIATDPAKVISELGRESGHCLYCQAELTQPASKLAGCGKKCSENWGAWYPNTAEVREYEKSEAVTA